MLPSSQMVLVETTLKTTLWRKLGLHTKTQLLKDRATSPGQSISHQVQPKASLIQVAEHTSVLQPIIAA